MFFLKKQENKPSLNQQGDLIRRHYLFFGRVQGVGFRYQSVRIAKALGVTGWVRNCDDGSVEMEAQGDAKQLETLLEELRQMSYVRIEHVEVNPLPVERERGFRTTY
jgi:acylphosphatase